MKRTPVYVVGRDLFLGFFRIFMPYRIIGRENLPESGRVIICSNHLSMKDPMLLAAISRKRMVHYMGKAELFRNKLVGAVVRAAGAFPVNRGHGDAGAIDFAHQLLEQEQVVGIFLEGTRSKTGEFLQPKSGTSVLAYQNHTPVLPVCITPVTGKFPKLFHRVTISCGPLIQPEELGITGESPREFRNASRYIMDHIVALRERDRAPMLK